MDNKEGFNIKITLEEDAYGTIARLVYCLQRRIINPDGLYYNPDLTRISNITIDVMDEADKYIMKYTFHHCYFLNAEEITYDYGADGSVSTAITFNADFVTREFAQDLLANVKPDPMPKVESTPPITQERLVKTYGEQISPQASTPAPQDTHTKKTQGNKTVSTVKGKSSIGTFQTSRMTINR
jgi:hypothetical protein